MPTDKQIIYLPFFLIGVNFLGDITSFRGEARDCAFSLFPPCYNYHREILSQLFSKLSNSTLSNYIKVIKLFFKIKILDLLHWYQ